MAHITACGASHAAIKSALSAKDPQVASMAYPVPLAPWVGVIMGSDSDLPTMQAAVAVLEDMGVPHEVRCLPTGVAWNLFDLHTAHEWETHAL